MKKITTLIAALALTTFGWQANAQSFNAGACPTGVAIPDNTPAGVDIIIPVTGAGTALGTDIILDQVNFHAIHTWQSDITVTLTSPNGVTVILSDGNGGSADNYGTDCTTMTNFNMSAVTNITAGTGDFAGMYIPQESLANFNDASSPNANWTLNVSDGASGDIGNVEFIELVFIAPPACPAPNTLMTSNTTLTSVDLGWTENGTATTWDIEYGVAPYTATGTPTVTGTTTNPYSLTGLTATTAYEYYVRADCGGANGTSTWAGPFTFFTGYCTPSSTDPSTYVDDFSTTNGSANISNLASGFTTGGYFDGTAQSVQSFATGSFDFNAAIVGGTAGFSIWIDWNNDLVFDDATEKVFNTTAYASGPFTGTITVPAATALGNYNMRITTDWNQSNPTDPCGAQARAEFEDYTVTVVAPPACLAPSALTVANITATSANLGWTENGTATTWDIEYGVAPYTATGTPTIAATTTNPQNLTGLTATTSYDFYVRADCGGANGTSTWAGPFTFMTACANFTAPFLEVFDGTTIPTCWSESAITGGPWEFSGSAGWAAAAFTDNTGNGGNFAWVDFSGTDDAGVILQMPVVDVSALSNAELTFALASYNTDDIDSNELYIEAWNGTAWTQVAMITQDSSLWMDHAYSLASFTYGANLTQIRFRAERDPNGSVFYTNDLLIDDVKIDDPLATSVSTNTNSINLSVYPNPTTGEFTLNVNTTDVNELDIKVMNIQGQVVFAKNNFDNISNVKEQIDLSENANGIYFVTVTTDKGVITHKVVVQ